MGERRERGKQAAAVAGGGSRQTGEESDGAAVGLSGEEARRVKAASKAIRNQRARDRRRRGLTPVISWQGQRFRRCTSCGVWLSESGTAGHGDGRRTCEPCFLGREIRVASLRALATAKPVTLSGAA